MYRPVLLSLASAEVNISEAGAAFWITRFGTKMAEISIFKRISELTEKHFGRPVNPHLFRDCAATSIGLDDPDHVAIIMDLLGHTTLATSERYYNHALGRQAANIQQGTIRDIRREFRRVDAIVKRRPATRGVQKCVV